MKRKQFKKTIQYLLNLESKGAAFFQRSNKTYTVFIRDVETFGTGSTWKNLRIIQKQLAAFGYVAIDGMNKMGGQLTLQFEVK